VDGGRHHPAVRRRTSGLLSTEERLRGPDNIAMALIGFDSLAAFEPYREKLIKDRDALGNLAFAERSGCILVEDRSFFHRIDEKATGIVI
jgi:hypothetical protein